jgi:hypothetical protein
MQPRPRADISLIRVTPSSVGLKVEVSVRRATSLNCGVWKVVQPVRNGPQQFEPITDSITVKLPEVARNTLEFSVLVVLIPVAIPADPSQSYDVSCTAGGDQSEESEAASVRFQGYSATVANSIKFTFTGDGLQVSAKTKDVTELYAKWQKSGNEQIDWSAASKHQDPSLTLPYSDIDSSAKTPSETVPLMVALRDSDGIVQEVRITLAVQATQGKTGTPLPETGGGKGKTLQDQIKTIQDPTAKLDQKNKVSFSWKTLAATGIGGILKYFVPLL